jgi:hypothetical protein
MIVDPNMDAGITVVFILDQNNGMPHTIKEPVRYAMHMMCPSQSHGTLVV